MRARPRVLFTGATLSDAARAAFAEAGLDPIVAPRDLNQEQLQSALSDCDAYVLAGIERVTELTVRAAPRLRVIAFLGVGYRSFIDAEMAARHGVAVTNSPGDNAMAVAEFTLSLALEATRRTAAMAAAVKQGQWRETITHGLIGRTVGIVGAGAIGAAFARMAHAAFGCRIFYHNRSPRPELEAQTGAMQLGLDALLRASDVVSLHTPLNAETEGMIGAAELMVMKPGAALICTGRAEIVQPRALKRALTAGPLGFAAFDGYYQEPAPPPARDPHGLLALENMLVSPHVAYLTHSALDAALRTNLTSINNILRNGADRFLVNPEYVNFEKTSR